MNIEDLDLNEEWQRFKETVGSSTFEVSITGKSVLVYDINDRIRLDSKIITIWEKIDLIELCPSSSFRITYRIRL